MTALKFYYFLPEHLYIYIYFSEQVLLVKDKKIKEKKTENFQKAILNNPRSNIKIKKQAAHSYRKMLT